MHRSKFQQMIHERFDNAPLLKWLREYVLKQSLINEFSIRELLSRIETLGHKSGIVLYPGGRGFILVQHPNMRDQSEIPFENLRQFERAYVSALRIVHIPDLVYTVGDARVYEPLFVTGSVKARKGQGGSVWETMPEALANCDPDRGFRVYGVVAHWSTDTEPRSGADWQALKEGAPMVKLIY